MPDYTSIFSENVNWIREQRKLTRQELAALLGVSGALMTELLRGTANPTLRIMETMAEGLGLPLTLLLTPQDASEWQAIRTTLATSKPSLEAKAPPHIPSGYELLEQVVLPKPKADVVKEWLAAPKRGRPRKQA